MPLSALPREAQRADCRLPALAVAPPRACRRAAAPRSCRAAVSLSKCGPAPQRHSARDRNGSHCFSFRAATVRERLPGRGRKPLAHPAGAGRLGCRGGTARRRTSRPAPPAASGPRPPRPASTVRDAPQRAAMRRSAPRRAGEIRRREFAPGLQNLLAGESLTRRFSPHFAPFRLPIGGLRGQAPKIEKNVFDFLPTAAGEKFSAKAAARWRRFCPRAGRCRWISRARVRAGAARGGWRRARR